MSAPATFTGPALVWHRENGMLRLDILPERATAMFSLDQVAELIEGRAAEMQEGEIIVASDIDTDSFTVKVKGSELEFFLPSEKLEEYAGLAKP